MRKRLRKKYHKRYLGDIVYEISISSYWRKRLFLSSEYSVSNIDKENMYDLHNYSKNKVRSIRLKYYVSLVPFADTKGWGDWDDNLIYFKFQPVEFPRIISFSGNNPNVI